MNHSRTYFMWIGLALIIGASSCASTSQMKVAGGAESPAAQGEVKLGTTDNGNTSVQFMVKHLAPPDRMNPGATVYLVWVRPLEPGSSATSLGAMQLNDNLEGEINAVTPLRAFDIFVTAEAMQTATWPTGKELLTQRVQMANK